MKTMRKCNGWDDRQFYLRLDDRKRKASEKLGTRLRICPYTLELLEDCPMRKPSFKRVCSFALEACST
jgi:hypothetical protein